MVTKEKLEAEIAELQKNIDDITKINHGTFDYRIPLYNAEISRRKEAIAKLTNAPQVPPAVGTIVPPVIATDKVKQTFTNDVKHKSSDEAGVVVTEEVVRKGGRRRK